MLDGEVEVRLMRLDTPAATPGKHGSVRLDGEPAGVPMGRIVARRGHMVLLPANAAYRFHADRPGVILLQTILGDDTVERWAEICLS